MVLGRVLGQSGRTEEEGIPTLERGMKLNPRDPRLRNILDLSANVFITAGNYNKAVELA